MTAIRTIDPGDAVGELADLYRSISDREGFVSNLYRAQSLAPAGLAAHEALDRALMVGPGPLSEAQRELVAVAVSQANACHY